MRALAILLLTATPAFADGDLFIYTWGEYTPPDLVAKFEAEFGVKVHIDSYDSMETMIAKLRAGGAGYDIIVPGDATMQTNGARSIGTPNASIPPPGPGAPLPSPWILPW